MSRLQLSEQKLFIRLQHSREGAAMPSFIALKDTVMVFFRYRAEERMQLLPPTSGVVALILHHGVRRDHRTGCVAADLSVCLLTKPMLDAAVPWWVGSGGAARDINCEADKIDTSSALSAYWLAEPRMRLAEASRLAAPVSPPTCTAILCGCSSRRSTRQTRWPVGRRQ
jgi:hypothetical protein